MTTFEHDALAISTSERQWAAATHWGGIALAFVTAWMIGAAGFVAPLGIQMYKGKESAFIADHAKESMNFNLSMFLYFAAGIVLAIILAGGTVLTLGLGAIISLPAFGLMLLAYGALSILWLVCGIIGSVKAIEGELYRYPLSLRLIK